MSRGTRIGGDVMGLMPEEEDDENDLYPFREKYSFPAGYCRTGRVGVLNRRLLDLYGSIGNAGNRMAKNRRRERHCTPLYLGKHWASELDSLQESTKELITDRHDFGYTATFLIAELEALGHQAYIPEEMVEFVRRPDPLVPFGSLSYLEKSPHYFTPEKYSVPEGLPTGYTDGYIGSVCDIGDANTCLERKYGVIARHLNRIRFFRDCRVRLGKSPADYVPGNSLTREVISCRHQFDKATILIKQYQGEPKLFTMPSELRDKVMEDYAVMSLEPLGDVSCLFPGDSQENYGASEDGAKLFLLYESASGYALFHIDGGQGMDTAFADYGSFRQTVRLTVYYPFPSTADAHKQYNAISKGIMTDELRSILACFLPDPTRGAQFNLGVIDPKLGGVISDETGITCRSDIIVDELFRGIRLYFNCFVELEGSDVDKFQLRLGHICSRDTANFNVNDMMIVQAISQLDTLDKNISYYSVRVRKCLSVRFPELMNIVEDNHIYAQLAQLIIKKPDLAEYDISSVVGIVGDETATKIVEAAKTSIGHNIELEDLEIVQRSVERLLSLLQSREKTHENIVKNMKYHAPNLSALIGEVTGARLISHAGSLLNLVSKSAHKLLRADNAYSSLVSRASIRNKGRMARYLATKCSAAANKDCSADAAEAHTNLYGEKLLREAEEKLHLLEAQMW